MSTSDIKQSVWKPQTLVVEALQCLADERGSTTQDIVNYVSSTYGTDKRVASRLVLMGLKKAADDGVIQCDGSRYDMLRDRGEDDDMVAPRRRRTRKPCHSLKRSCKRRRRTSCRRKRRPRKSRCRRRRRSSCRRRRRKSACRRRRRRSRCRRRRC